MNEYEQGKELSAMARHPQQPTVVGVDIKNVKLTDFMKALGQEHPVAADGNLRIYNAPYDDNPGPTMVINIETNLWRDTKSGAYGSIYDLAHELTGSCQQRLRVVSLRRIVELHIPESLDRLFAESSHELRQRYVLDVILCVPHRLKLVFEV